MDLWQLLVLKEKKAFYFEIFNKIKNEINSFSEDDEFMYVINSKKEKFKKRKILLDHWVSSEFNIQFYSQDMNEAKKIFDQKTLQTINIVDCFLRKEKTL